VLTEEGVKVTLVHDEKRDLGVELAKATDLAVLLRHQALLKDGELDEETTRREIEVGAKAAHRHTLLVPVQRELQGFVDPLKAVESKQLREELFARVGEGLRNAGYHARMATTRVVAP
jgi:hypothetical protein